MKSQFLPVSFSRKTCCPPSRLEPISPGISPLKRLPFAWAALCLIILLIGALAARADYPSILVIDSVGYAGTPVSGIDAEEYDTGGNGVLILYVSTGGTAVWGDNLNDALNSPSETSTWDGGMHVYLSSHTVLVPEVLVYNAPAATMYGYDNNQRQPICGNVINGSWVQAYNGFPDQYIFNFGDGTPCYRYQAGSQAMSLYYGGWWPESNITCTFPQSLYVNDQLWTVSAFDDGINNGYYFDVYYSGNGNADLHVYASSDSPTGIISGNVGSNYFCLVSRICG